MKKSMWVMLLLLGINFGNIWNYVVSPSNCALEYGVKVVDATLDLGKCIYNNVTFQG